MQNYLKIISRYDVVPNAIHICKLIHTSEEIFETKQRGARISWRKKGGKCGKSKGNERKKNKMGKIVNS